MSLCIYNRFSHIFTNSMNIMEYTHSPGIYISIFVDIVKYMMELS